VLTTESDHALVVLDDVGKSFGAVRALDGVTARIEPGVIGLLGPNGAGKSTLLKVLLGLLDSEGSATVLGFSPATDAFRIRDKVGYMPEKDSYLAGMTAVELCAYAGELCGLPRREAMQRAHESLYYAGLEDKRYQKVEGYSSGLKQRVKLAQALVHDPVLLFLDEPTNGLDPRARDDMLELVTDLPKRRECSIILSTHLLPDVEQVCDRVVIMQSGRLRFSGTIAELRGGGGGDVFDVEIKGELSALVERLTAAGCAVVEHPPLAATVTLNPDQSPMLVVREARAAGCQVRHLAPRTLSLEDAFLRELESEAL